MTSEVPAHDVVVSILNYRTAEMTINCVKSVCKDLCVTPEVKAHVVVVDTASGAGSERVIADWLPGQPSDLPVTLVQSAHHAGVSNGHNQGIPAQKAPQAGIFAPRIDYDDGLQQVHCLRVHNPLSALIRAAATGPFTKIFQRHELSFNMPPVSGQAGWASFAGSLLRAEMIDETGLMDEDYFLRARRAGWQISCVPQARFIHFRGDSAPVKALARARKWLPKYSCTARMRLLCHAHGHAGLSWHLGRILARLRRMAGKPVPPAMAREWRDTWTNALTLIGNSCRPENG